MRSKHERGELLVCHAVPRSLLHEGPVEIGVALPDVVEAAGWLIHLGVQLGMLTTRSYLPLVGRMLHVDRPGGKEVVGVRGSPGTSRQTRCQRVEMVYSCRSSSIDVTGNDFEGRVEALAGSARRGSTL